MKNKTVDKYLEKSKDFWNVPDVKIAMFRRIATDFSKPYNELDFDEQYQAWNKSIKESLTKIFEPLPTEPDWKILEIGCGIGRLIKPLREKYAQVDGVDISQKMIEYSKEYLADGKQNGTMNHNDGMSFPMLDDEKYDLVYSIITFQHIRSYEVIKSYLSETLRVLKRGGYFRLQVVEANDRMGKYNEEASTEKEYDFFGNAYTKNELNQILSEAGFTDIEIAHKPANIEENWLWATARKK